MERCPDSEIRVAMAPLNAGWNDLGTWDAIQNTLPHDADGNAVVGDAVVMNTQNTLVYASHRLVATLGVNDVVIIETADAVLVTHRNQSNSIKDLVARLEKQGRLEPNFHRKVNRPWGWYDSIDHGDGFQVKRIMVKPGASLSLQKHEHRSEHWIVVRGQAQVTNGDQTFSLKANQSTYIPRGQKHRLANLCPEPLEIIEIQTGSYLGEDDIIRFDDIYRRN